MKLAIPTISIENGTEHTKRYLVIVKETEANRGKKEKRIEFNKVDIFRNDKMELEVKLAE